MGCGTGCALKGWAKDRRHGALRNGLEIFVKNLDKCDFGLDFCRKWLYAVCPIAQYLVISLQISIFAS